jgi:MFS family permease
MRPEAPAAQRNFLLLYALAWAGTAIAYMPFLTVLLPVRIEAMVAPGANGMALSWLAATTFAGALAASAGNILFGWASDMWFGRRPWIITGLILSSLLLVLTQWATSLGGLVAILVGWQLAINMMIGPLSAWAGDSVPDAQKGRLGGLLAFAPAAGAIAGAFVTLPGLAGPPARLMIVALLTVICVAPLLLFGATGDHSPSAVVPNAPVPVQPDRALVKRMWLARLLVQISEATLFAYLYFWLRSLDPSLGDASTAQIFGIALIIAAPLTLLTGAWADRHGHMLLPLRIGALLAAAALLIMGFTGTPAIAIIGYAVFSIACSIFLALHSAQTLRVLPRSDRRGRDLGIFNLTNTLPSLVMPALTLALVPALGFRALFVLLAILALGAAALLAPVRPR